MNKKFLIVPLLLALITGCGVSTSSEVTTSTPISAEDSSESNPTSEAPSSSEEVNTSEDVTSEEPITSEPGTSLPPVTSEPPSTSEPGSSQPGTSEPENIYHNISEIRNIAMTLPNGSSEINVYTSTIKASFRAQLLAYQDYINSGSYTYPNKALVANETGYILVAINQDHYKNISGYASLQQVYDYEGTITYYNGEPELTLTKAPTYVSDVTLNYDLAVEDRTSIMNVFNEMKTIKQNKSATGYIARPMQLTLRYLMKLESSIGLFTDGVNVIQVHGWSNLTNKFFVNTVYDVTFMPGFYRAKPSFTYIASSVNNEMEVVELEKPQMTAAQLYSYSYVKEPKTQSDWNKNLVYAEKLLSLYTFQGYVNYYVKNNAAYIVFDDIAKANYSTETSATSAKALFANNDSSRVLYKDSDFLNCVFWEEASTAKLKKNLVEFVFVPYVMNTNNYFQIHVFEETYSVLS